MSDGNARNGPMGNFTSTAQDDSIEIKMDRVERIGSAVLELQRT